ncbi:MAG: hypothetical protein DHS20C01_18970 [marine bacterium B5-7]|nr:MAG: hypothetical protein DHS20C01_18970 [marine bacterium B5-7]
MAIPVIQKAVAIFWSSFIMAGVATLVFFAVFDPFELIAPTWFPNLSRLGAYSIGFFLFWMLTLSTSLLTSFFQRPVEQFNKS